MRDESLDGFLHCGYTGGTEWPWHRFVQRLLLDLGENVGPVIGCSGPASAVETSATNRWGFDDASLPTGVAATVHVHLRLAVPGAHRRV